MQLNDGNINGMDMPQADKNDKTALQAGTNTRGRDGKLVSMQIRDYLDLLSSDAPAPGGVRFLQLRERLWWPWSVS